MLKQSCGIKFQLGNYCEQQTLFFQEQASEEYQQPGFSLVGELVTYFLREIFIPPSIVCPFYSLCIQQANISHISLMSSNLSGMIICFFCPSEIFHPCQVFPLPHFFSTQTSNCLLPIFKLYSFLYSIFKITLLFFSPMTLFFTCTPFFFITQHCFLNMGLMKMIFRSMQEPIVCQKCILCCLLLHLLVFHFSEEELIFLILINFKSWVSYHLHCLISQ